jgi:hypothetical protein
LLETIEITIENPESKSFGDLFDELKTRLSSHLPTGRGRKGYCLLNLNGIDRSFGEWIFRYEMERMSLGEWQSYHEKTSPGQQERFRKANNHKSRAL